ncbi:hypothetical protein M885DRAFT_513526 [Pelagophyceae sp. CCMP2097]|nr:hypothetical protein M885DRAFT_513526 [Pelagophyceae sp. CCMP2097]
MASGARWLWALWVLRSAGGLAPQRLEARIVAGAVPLAPRAAADAARELRDVGVVRVDGVVSPDLAAALKARVLSELSRKTSQWAVDDLQMVPGTRLRFCEAVEIEFDGGTRSDVLLPLDDELVRAALTQAATKLRPALVAAARACLPGDDALDDEAALELIECAALYCHPGADHQALHADFLRYDDAQLDAFMDAELGDDAADDDEDDEEEEEEEEGDDEGDGDVDGDLPPRLVTFVFLQDCPTAAHGATVFLPATSNAEAHLQNEFDDESLLENYGPARLATVRAGDAVVYDASVLHFGAANSVQGNDRVVLYFSVARPGAAAAAFATAKMPMPEGLAAAPPVPFATLVNDLNVLLKV